MSFWMIVGILVVAMLALGIASAIATSKKQNEIGVAISKIKDFTPSFQYLGADGNSGIATDDGRSKVCLFARRGGTISHRLLDHREILSSELFEDGSTVVKTARSSQVGGALVGGVLLGGLGAVVGGLSGKKVESGKVRRIELRLVVNDSARPTHEVCFLNVEVGRDSFLYKTTAETARQWQARMDVLIKRADREDTSRKVERTTSGSNVSDELQKLADLRDRGVLTEAEFASQKAKLLAS